MAEPQALRVGVLTQFGLWSASTRARAVHYVAGLEAQGHHVEVLLANDRPPRHPGRLGQLRYFASHGLRYLRRYVEIKRALSHLDAVLVQRGVYAMGPGFIIRPIERFRGRVVFDLDDDLFAVTPSMEGKGRLAQWLYGPQQAARVLRRADAVVVSTERLAQVLPAHRGVLRVLPTIPDISTYAVCEDGGVDGLVGWAGTTGGLRYLDPLRDVFSELQTTGKGQLEVVCSERWDGPASFVPWRVEDEPTMFSKWAIGIMPLPQTEYARAKAGYKLLQYMAAGVACVASPVGVNVELLEASGAGILASTPDEWRAALERLLSDRDLRVSMGKAGRAFVEQYANVGNHVAVLSQLLSGESPEMNNW